MPKLLGCLIGAVLLAACSSETPDVLVEPLVLGADEDARDFRRSVFPTGPAELVVELEGSGSLRVTAQVEGAEPLTVVELEGPGPRRTARGSVSPGAPPEGRRTVPTLLHFATTGELRVLGYGLSEDEGSGRRPSTDVRGDLRGALRGRDVLLILFDSLHSGHLDSYGYERPTAPNVTRLAEGGTRFDRAYSQTSWTISSTVSLFTSLDQERHGVQLVGQGLSDACTTLGELFQEAGYTTEALIQNGVLNDGVGIERGFDRFTRPGDEWMTTTDLFERVRETLVAERERPAFVYAHLLPPHMPYKPSKEHRGRFAPPYDGDARGSIRWVVRVSGRPRDDPDLMHVTALYDELIATIDAKLGVLLDELDAAGRLDDTLIVVVADHGEAFNQHGITGHNFHVYEEMVRVPWILHAPGSDLPRARTIDAPVTLLDVAPTLVDLCALPEPQTRFVGRSRVDLLGGAEPRAEPVFLSARYRESEGVVRTPQVALVLDGYKLVAPPDLASAELFDLERDPEEQHDVASAHPTRVAAMIAALREWLERAERERLAAPHVGGVDEQALRDLGYMGDDEEAGAPPGDG